MPAPTTPSSARPDPARLQRRAFSHHNICPDDARLALEARYAHLLQETTRFNRQLVSYQGNKGELLHSWLRYREGFSAELVELLLQEFALPPDGRILDPFAGSATTLLVAKQRGLDAVGIEILPVCHLAWEAKSIFPAYSLEELNQILRLLRATPPQKTTAQFPHVKITQGAFAPETENDLMFYTAWLAQLDVSAASKTLLRLLLTSILEEVSYTRKDGQYLRWDGRSPKIQKRHAQRLAQGKKPGRVADFGPLPTVQQALTAVLESAIHDISQLQAFALPDSRQTLIQGNALTLLPSLEAEQFDAVITSPPYCNRYDYTRTYALELAYLNVGQEIFQLRQEQLSCTVENRPKLAALRQAYATLGATERFDRIIALVEANPPLNEVNEALRTRQARGDLNNQGVLAMVAQYFTELAFVFAELMRTCKPGAYVAFVNDNVRYGGEVIPVDLITTHLAETLGFVPIRVDVLPQRKGNSSQQMGKFGREALRKSITIWRKPENL